jgi:hypothetical protein
MRVNQIDHVEIEVPNRYEAARRYHAALGFDICREYEFWAETASGPLMISTDGGKTKVALFDGCPEGATHPIGIRRIAFRMAGLTGIDAVRRSSVSDHEKSFSVYFADPWGNQLEVTTHEEQIVRTQLACIALPPRRMSDAG